MEALTFKLIVRINATKNFHEVTYLKRKIISPNISELDIIFYDFIQSINEIHFIPSRYSYEKTNSLYLVFAFKTKKESYTERIRIFDGYGLSKESNLWFYQRHSWLFGYNNLVENNDMVRKIIRYIIEKFNQYNQIHYNKL